jgi:hypothetical protein
MAKFRILLDSNAYLRLANSFHPLLHESFGQQSYVLYVIPEFQKEFDKSPRLKNKFGWVNQPEYVENRKRRIRITRSEKEQVRLTYSYIWEHNISQRLGASRVDVRALAYGAVLGVSVITDDSDMNELGKVFGIREFYMRSFSPGSLKLEGLYNPISRMFYYYHFLRLKFSIGVILGTSIGILVGD